MDGLKACNTLSKEEIPTNVTLCFSPNQALLEDIRTIYDNYGFETEILAASIRNVNHVKDCALIGADVITAPPNVVKSLSNHVLTDKGLAAFLKDWEGTGQTI